MCLSAVSGSAPLLTSTETVRRAPRSRPSSLPPRRRPYARRRWRHPRPVTANSRIVSHATTTDKRGRLADRAGQVAETCRTHTCKRHGTRYSDTRYHSAGKRPRALSSPVARWTAADHGVERPDPISIRPPELRPTRSTRTLSSRSCTAAVEPSTRSVCHPGACSGAARGQGQAQPGGAVHHARPHRGDPVSTTAIPEALQSPCHDGGCSSERRGWAAIVLTAGRLILSTCDWCLPTNHQGQHPPTTSAIEQAITIEDQLQQPMHNAWLQLLVIHSIGLAAARDPASMDREQYY